MSTTVQVIQNRHLKVPSQRTSSLLKYSGHFAVIKICLGLFSISIYSLAKILTEFSTSFGSDENICIKWDKTFGCCLDTFESRSLQPLAHWSDVKSFKNPTRTSSETTNEMNISDDSKFLAMAISKMKNNARYTCEVNIGKSNLTGKCSQKKHHFSIW